MPQVPPRNAARAAYAAAALNLLAAVLMLAVLRPGLPVEGSRPADRLAYLVDHRAAWWIGWLSWHAAAISLVAFYIGLAGQWRDRAPILTALALVCAGA